MTGKEVGKPGVVILAKNHCPYCKAAKQLLAGKKVIFEETDITEDEAAFEALTKQTGYQTMPQIFIDNRFIGGFDDLKALDESGKLDKMLQTFSA